MKKNRLVAFKLAAAILTATAIGTLLILPSMLSNVFENLVGRRSFGGDTDHDTYARLKWGVFGDALTSAAPLGVALGAGLFACSLLWNKNERKKLSNVIFCPLLFVLVGFSIMNYGISDELIDPRMQAVIDVIIWILGLLVLFKTFRVPTEKMQDRILQTTTVFLISSQAVLLAGIYSVLWGFDIEKYIQLANAKIISGSGTVIPNFSNSNLTWISYVTIAGGIIISLFVYMLGSNKQDMHPY